MVSAGDVKTMHRLLIYLLLSCLVGTGAMASEKLRFQQGGPRDGSMPDFFLVSDVSVYGEGSQIYITRSQFERVLEAIEDASHAHSDLDTQVFIITRFLDDLERETLYMPDGAVAGVLNDLVSMMRAQGTEEPAFLAEIIGSLTCGPVRVCSKDANAQSTD